MTPANERKAKERKAKREAGLVRVEAWVPQGMQAFAKSFVEAVCRENVGGPPKTATEIVEIEKNRPPFQAVYKRCGHCYGSGWEYSGNLMKPVGDGRPCPYCVGGFTK